MEGTIGYTEYWMCFCIRGCGGVGRIRVFTLLHTCLMNPTKHAFQYTYFSFIFSISHNHIAHPFSVTPVKVALVMAVEEEQAIWNITSSEYFKNAAWTRLQTKLSARGYNYSGKLFFAKFNNDIIMFSNQCRLISVDHLKKAWKNIKDQHRRAKADGYKKWPYKDFMQFMERALVHHLTLDILV